MNTIRSTLHQSEQPAAKSAVAALQEENALLFKQLHIVQEELERVHHASSSHRPSAGGRVVVEDGRFPEVAAENLRYRAILEAHRTISATGGEHTTAAGLGEILIKGTTSASAFVAMPMRLLSVWRKEKKQKPPKKLGGQSFSEVIAAYEKGGVAALDSLLASVSLSSTTEANALTAVARSQMHTDPAMAVELARRAYALEPRPFRLKWLAFRMHEAGELVEAEAILETLPVDTKFSDSESRQANRLRNEAKQVRLREALQSSGYAERRGKVEHQIATLEQACREQSELATQRGCDLESLRAIQDRLQQENSTLTAQLVGQAATISELRRATEALRTTQSQLQAENRELRAQLATQVGLTEELDQAVQVLESAATHADKEMQMLLAQCTEQTELAAGHGRVVADMQAEVERAEQENLALRARYAEQAELAAERGRAIEALQAATLQLEREKSALIAHQKEQAELAAENDLAVAALRTAASLLEQEKSDLAAQYAELATLADARGRAVAEIQTAKAALQQENAALSVKHVEQYELAAERGRAVEALKADQAELQEEHTRLRARFEEQSRHAQEQAPEIKILQDQLQSRHVIESDLAARQQGMQEELVKAEAQLDLIKDMLFRGARL